MAMSESGPGVPEFGAPQFQGGMYAPEPGAPQFQGGMYAPEPGAPQFQGATYAPEPGAPQFQGAYAPEPGVPQFQSPSPALPDFSGPGAPPTSHRIGDLKIVLSDPEKRSEGINPHIIYMVKSMLRGAQTSSVPRRYSDFVWLSDTLADDIAGAIVPPLPEKAVVGRFTPEVCV